MLLNNHYNSRDLKGLKDKLINRMTILAKQMEHTERDHLEFDLLDKIIGYLNKLINLEYN